MTVDPAIHFTLRAALSLLFLWAAAHKLRDVEAFTQALSGYRLLPESLVRPASVCLIAVEVAIACSLPLLSGSAPALAASVLLAMYAGAIAVNLARGRRDIDCGCAGPADRQPLSGGLVARNVVLCATALAAALPSSPRPLTWMDALTITAAVAFLSLLYATIDGLVANPPRLITLRAGGTAQALPPTLGSFGGHARPQAPGAGIRRGVR